MLRLPSVGSLQAHQTMCCHICLIGVGVYFVQRLLGRQLQQGLGILLIAFPAAVQRPPV